MLLDQRKKMVVAIVIVIVLLVLLSIFMKNIKKIILIIRKPEIGFFFYVFDSIMTIYRNVSLTNGGYEMITKFKEKTPKVKGWVADSSNVIGNVILEENTSVFFNSVIRGDKDAIVVDEGTNIQDGCILHTDPGHQLHIGKHVTIGHGCILHGCLIEDHVMIGMGSIVMNGAHIKKNTIIGAGSLVSEGKVIDENTVAFGSPISKMKTIRKEQMAMIEENAKHYILLSKEYEEENK